MKWEKGRSSVCSIGKLYVTNPLRKEAVAEELFILRKRCLLKLFRGSFSFGSSFCPRKCLKSQAGPEEFPNSYYVMSSQLNLRIILQINEMFQRFDFITKRLILTVAVNVWFLECKFPKVGFLWSSFSSPSYQSFGVKKTKFKISPKMTACLPLIVKLLKPCWASH